MGGSNILKYLMWVKNDGINFRIYKNVKELHLFISGYIYGIQCFPESPNFKNEIWINDFSVFCDYELNKSNNVDKEWEAVSSYHDGITKIQKDDKNGLEIFFRLFEKFLQANKF